MFIKLGKSPVLFHCFQKLRLEGLKYLFSLGAIFKGDIDRYIVSKTEWSKWLSSNWHVRNSCQNWLGLTERTLLTACKCKKCFSVEERLYLLWFALEGRTWNSGWQLQYSEGDFSPVPCMYLALRTYRMLAHILWVSWWLWNGKTP